MKWDTHNNIVGINYCSTGNLFTSDVSIANGIINKLINGELVYLYPIDKTTYPNTNGIYHETRLTQTNL